MLQGVPSAMYSSCIPAIAEHSMHSTDFSRALEDLR